MNIKKHKKTIMILLGIALLTTLLGCTQTNQEQTTTNTQNELTTLKPQYKEVFEYATSCYWAVECKEYPTYCEDNFKGIKNDLNAEEISTHYLTECEKMEPKWQTYKDTYNKIYDELGGVN